MTNDPTFIEGVRLTPEPPEGQGDWVDFTADEPWYRCPVEAGSGRSDGGARL